MASIASAAARLLPLLALLALHLTPACDAAEALPHQEQLLDPTVYHWPAFSSGRRLQAAEPAAGMAQAAAETAVSTGRRLQAVEPAAAEAAAAKAPKAKVMAAFRPAGKLKGKAVAVPTAGVPQVAALPASTVELKAEDTTWQAELDSLFDDPTAAAAQEVTQAEGTPAAATEPKAAAPAATEAEQPPAAAAPAPAPAKQEPAAEEQQEQPATSVASEEAEQPAAPVASEEAEQPAADAQAEPQPAADSATPGTDAFKQAVNEAVSKVIQEMMAKGTLGQVGQQQQEQVLPHPKSTAPAPFAGRFANTQQPGVDVPAAAAKPQAPRKKVSSGDAGSMSEDKQQQQQAGDKPAAATVDHPDKQPQAVSTPAVHSEPPAPATQPPVVQADPPKPAVIVTPAQPAAPKVPSKATKATKGTASQMQQQLLGGMFGGIFGETKLPVHDADSTARDVAAPIVGLGLFAGGGDTTEALQLLMLSEKQRKANLAQKAQQALLPPHIAAAPAKASAARRKKVDANELLNNMFGF